MITHHRVRSTKSHDADHPHVLILCCVSEHQAHGYFYPYIYIHSPAHQSIQGMVNMLCGGLVSQSRSMTITFRASAWLESLLAQVKVICVVLRMLAEQNIYDGCFVPLNLYMRGDWIWYGTDEEVPAQVHSGHWAIYRVVDVHPIADTPPI